MRPATTTVLQPKRGHKRDWLVNLCLGYLGLLALVAFGNGILSLFGIFPTGHSFFESSATAAESLQGPTWKHWSGTDINGRDLMTRILFGAQISLTVALFGTIISLTVGVTYGMISGYVGGVVDNLMMRFVDILFALPQLLEAIIFITISEPFVTHLFSAIHMYGWVSPRVFLLILFLGLTDWMTMSRIIRAQVLVLRQQQYIQAAKSLGQSHIMILLRHILPNLSGIIIVYLTLTIPSIMVNESFLSFLGLGVQAPLASWGTLIADAANNLNPLQIQWWLLLFPGATMILTLLAFNFIGDYLRDRFDPRSLTK
jgi:peptide/nickel transport system permease protein/oligopeptide transport system permease protein